MADVTEETQDVGSDAAQDGPGTAVDALLKAVKIAAAGAAVGAAAAAAQALSSHRSEHEDDEDEEPGQDEEPRAEGGEEEGEEEQEPEHEETEEPAASFGPEEHEYEPQARDDEAEEDEREPVEGASAGDVRSVAQRARAQLEELLGREVESVSSLERTHDGWVAQLEVVELSRIPQSTDVLGSYELELDGDLNFRRYQQVRRYHRSQADNGGGM
jgi:hypothetical protein